MIFIKTSTILSILYIQFSAMAGSFASVMPSGYQLARGASADNTVLINGPQDYCLIVPKDPHTNIGDSEYPGGMTTYCTAAAKSNSQGEISSEFWVNVDYAEGYGVNGERYVQLTGCINPETLDQINPGDAGGQYDSSGGTDGRGNPAGSACDGYKHYVELLEPAGSRACIRCCDDPADCPTDKDTEGCPEVIPGKYFECD